MKKPADKASQSPQESASVKDDQSTDFDIQAALRRIESNQREVLRILKNSHVYNVDEKQRNKLWKLIGRNK